MTETIKWSFSTDRCFRRCQRQYFLSHIAASHSAKDEVRREAFLNKQVKTLELWRGSLVHTGIEQFVVPAWQQRHPVDWQAAIEQTQELARRQLAFSSARRYREDGMTKSKAGEDYCALVGHESNAGVNDDEFTTVLTTIETCFHNLSTMADLLAEIQRSDKVWCELPLYIRYDAARLEVHLDLLYFRSFGSPTIIDWKVSESMGGSDADLQTGLYGWAMCQHDKWPVTEASDCELVEVQLLSGDIIRHRASPDIFDQIENRIYRSRLVDQPRGGDYRNATAGSWEPLDDREGIVCTTGFPFKFPGTAKPLCIRIVEGALNLPDILEDTFAMSQLCWPAPDRCMRLSIDLKLCDDHLRSIAAASDDDEGQFGDGGEEWAEDRQVVGWSA